MKTPEMVLAETVRAAVEVYHSETGRRPNFALGWADVSTLDQPARFVLDHVQISSEKTDRWVARA